MCLHTPRFMCLFSVEYEVKLRMCLHQVDLAEWIQPVNIKNTNYKKKKKDERGVGYELVKGSWHTCILWFAFIVIKQICMMQILQLLLQEQKKKKTWGK